jgi:hypothetical protein
MIRSTYRQALASMILHILKTDSTVFYIQGMHDVCSVVLLICGEHLGADMILAMTKTHLRYLVICRVGTYGVCSDFYRDTITVVMAGLNLLFPLIGRANTDLQSFLVKSNVDILYG